MLKNRVFLGGTCINTVKTPTYSLLISEVNITIFKKLNIIEKITFYGQSCDLLSNLLNGVRFLLAINSNFVCE